MEKNNYKLMSFLVIITFVLLFVSLINLVGAQVNDPIEPNKIILSVINWAKSNYGPLFGALFGSNTLNDFLFAKILMFFLIFSVVYIALGKIDLFANKRLILVVVTTVVSILSVRYLKEDTFIEGLMLPYGGMGAAIVVFLPLLIYFMFVHNSVAGSFGRRAAWLIYAAFFTALWWSRQGNISGTAHTAYLVGIIFIGVAFAFDQSIHSYFKYADFAKARSVSGKRQIRHLKKELWELDDLFAKKLVTLSEYNKRVDEISRTIRTLSKS